MAVGDGDDADGSSHGTSSRAFRNEGGGLANSRESWIGPSTISSKRETFLAGCWTGEGAENRKGDDGDDDGGGDSVGDGEGGSTNSSSVGRVSVALGVRSLDARDGVRLAVDPGSDHSPTLFPSTKVVCNRV